MVVLTLQSSNRVEIYKPDGSSITKETNEEGRGIRVKPEELEQAELFGTDNYRRAKQYVDSNIFMSPRERAKGESRPKSGLAVGKEEMR
ncbi:MAG: hypothetical protein PVJ67_07215 [Candidatus Pacearchaeota archaeon]|jgi:hypothetical protein